MACLGVGGAICWSRERCGNCLPPESDRGPCRAFVSPWGVRRRGPPWLEQRTWPGRCCGGGGGIAEVLTCQGK